MTEGHDGARAVNPVRGVHRLAVLTAAATFLLLFVGGLVTSTGSGLAVPDWPLSFGRFFPVLQITLGGATIWSSRAVPATTKPPRHRRSTARDEPHPHAAREPFRRLASTCPRHGRAR